MAQLVERQTGNKSDASSRLVADGVAVLCP